MLGHPKFDYKDIVWFELDGLKKTGYIYIIDRYGTFGQDKEVSYDIMVKSENILYKHIPEPFVNKVDGAEYADIMYCKDNAQDNFVKIGTMSYDQKTNKCTSALTITPEHMKKVDPDINVKSLMEYIDGMPGDVENRYHSISEFAKVCVNEIRIVLRNIE